MADQPRAQVISRALRRDAKIIAVPVTRAGYHVRQGSIAVSCSDLPDAASDKRDARYLRAYLVALGWVIEPLGPDDSILRVNHVPSAAEVRAAERKGVS